MMIRAVTVFWLISMACGWARAQPAGVAAVYGAYSGCMVRLAGREDFAPLAAAGFFPGDAGGGRAFMSATQARLMARYQSEAAVCQDDLRVELDNFDPGLADLASQAQQLGDVNALMLFNRAESWGGYVSNRRFIDGNFWRAAQAAEHGDGGDAARVAEGDGDGADDGVN